MELQSVLIAQIVVGLVLCLPTLIVSTVRMPFGIGAGRPARSRTIMGRSKYAFYAA